MRRPQMVLVAAMAVLGLGVAAGCGSGEESAPEIASADDGKAEDTPKPAADGEAPAKDPEARQLQYADCLRDNGVEVEDAGGPDEGVKFKEGQGKAEEISKAMEACRKYAPSGAADDSTTKEETKKQMMTYISCLRDQGVDIGDPDPETGTLAAEDMPKAFAEEPTKEQEACKDKRPQTTPRK